MRRTAAIISLAVAICLTACDQISFDFGRKPVLSVGTKVLYYDEIEAIMPAGLTPHDSTVFVESYKKHWATDALLYEKAIENIKNTDEIDKIVEDYRRNLIINEYQQQIAIQNLAPVEEDSIKAFYDIEKSNFKLDEVIMKGIVLRIPLKTPEQGKLLKLLANYNEEGNMEEIAHYCTKYALKYEFFSETWTPYNDIAPILAKPIDCGHIITGRTISQVADDFCCYLLIIDILHPGDPKPLEFIRDDIFKILYSRNKVRYIGTFKENLYQKGLSNQLITIYNDSTDIK